MAFVPEFVISGAVEPTTLIVGHSHIIAYAGAGEHLSAEKSRRRYGVVYSRNPELWTSLSEPYWSFVLAQPSPEICLCWNGNQHNANFLLETDPRITLCGSVGGSQFNNDRDSKRTVVSYSMIDELWASDFLRLRQVLAKLSERKRVFLVGTPPPKPRSEIASRLESDEFFAQKVRLFDGDSIEDRVSPDDFRIRLWLRMQQTLQKIASEAGSPFIAVPDACYEPNFLLRAEMSVPDASHANELFAIEMLKAIDQVDRKIT